jgi:hypothetical protein
LDQAGLPHNKRLAATILAYTSAPWNHGETARRAAMSVLIDGSAGFDCCLKRDEMRTKRHRALGCCLSMISAQTRSALVARENRFALFRIVR